MLSGSHHGVEASLDGVPSALNYFVDPEAVHIYFLAPLAEPACSGLGSGELCEESYKGVADDACAVWLMLGAGLTAGFQEWQPIHCIAVEVQACAAASTMRAELQPQIDMSCAIKLPFCQMCRVYTTRPMPGLAIFARG